MEAVLEDKALLAELIDLKDYNAFQVAFKAKGMELTNELREQISGSFGGYYSSMVEKLRKKRT